MTCKKLSNLIKEDKNEIFFCLKTSVWLLIIRIPINQKWIGLHVHAYSTHTYSQTHIDSIDTHTNIQIDTYGIGFYSQWKTEGWDGEIESQSEIERQKERLSDRERDTEMLWEREKVREWKREIWKRENVKEWEFERERI